MTKIEKLEEILNRFLNDKKSLEGHQRIGYEIGLNRALTEAQKLKANINIPDEVLPEKYGVNELVYDKKVFGEEKKYRVKIANCLQGIEMNEAEYKAFNQKGSPLDNPHLTEEYKKRFRNFMLSKAFKDLNEQVKMINKSRLENNESKNPISPEEITYMNLQYLIKEDLFNNLTIQNLDSASRLADIHINKVILDKLIDVVELVLEKGDQVTIKDISDLNNPK